ncbi:hypothetical protein JMJ35_007640 [Cladonia borealis]|uniref:Fungal N-terminal domain-containing protein n=1 Tax=Cladonia borealis TaxID=184061 RepID=A0AA39QYN9_9LECA|nr:hypothetical protein JMJ35_007640 [Cladonia borealis]
MDPLSVTASIIALFQAGGTVSKGLKKIANLRNAPDILLALNNEVADLHALLGNIDDVLRHHREIIGLEPIVSLCRALDRAKRTLLELENVLAYKLTSIRCKDGESHQVLDRSSWLRLESRVQRLKDEIREDKVSLSSELSVLTSLTALRTNAQIRDVYILLGTMRLESRISKTSRIEACTQPTTENEDPSEQAPMVPPQPVQDGQGTEMNPDTVTGTEKQASLPGVVLANTGSAEFELQPFITTFEITRNSCGSHCDCTCHRKFRFRSPDFLDAVFGTLFLGYQASPWFSQGCRNRRCRGSSTRLQYMFPKWFVKRSVALTIACSQPKGPELILRVLRLRPDTAFVFVCARHGYYDELKRLLENGEASILDIDERNQTALSIAINSGQFDIAKLLLQAGSDLFHEDGYGDQPIKEVLRRFLLGKICGTRNEFEDRLFNLVNGQAHIDILDLPELTKAFLGLNPQPFDCVLRSTPRVSVDLADYCGGTALHWASRAGDWEAVEQLIHCGADPNKPDNFGYSSLHMSIYDSRCLELLLRAKADVDMKDNDDRTAMHRLSVYGSDTTNLDLLVRFGANIEATDRFGLTPLLLAVLEDNHLMVSDLLERGADINAGNLDGDTCLFLALWYNSHDSLGILLDNTSLRYNVKFDKGQTLFHIAAIYADIESLDILMSKGLYQLDTAEEDLHGLTAMQYAQFRRLENEEWSTRARRPCDKDPTERYNMVEELLESITEAQASMAGYYDDEASEEETANSEVSYDSSGEDSIEEDQDGEELWEDAREDLDGQS